MKILYPQLVCFGYHFLENLPVLKTITKYYRVLQCIAEYCRVLQSVTECYRVLQIVTEYYRILQSNSSASTWTNFWAC